MKTPKARRLPSGRWFVRVMINGETINITENTEARAVAAAIALKAHAHDVALDAGKMLIGDACDRYIDERDGIISPSTIKAYRSYRAHRFASLMSRPIRDLDRAAAQTAVKLEARQVSAKTVRNAWLFIASAVNAVVAGAAPHVILPSPPPSKGKAIDADTLRAIFAEIRGTAYELPLLLDAFLGLRRSELLALRKSDFDFDRNTVTISRALIQDAGGEWIERDTTKTPAGMRTISVDPVLIEKIKTAPDGRLVTMHPNTLYNFLYKLTRRLGLPHVRLHDFRHTFASVSHLIGVPDKYTMTAGGWASKPVLDTVYTHAIDAEQKRFQDAVSDYYKRLLVP